MEYLFYYMLTTPNKTQQISVKTQGFFVKAELRHMKLQLLVNHFILFLLTFFSKIIIF